MTSPMRLLVVAAAILLVPASTFAQTGLTASIGRALNAVGEPGVSADRRQTTVGDLQVEHRFDDGRVRLFYEFDGGTFTTEGDWRYLLHTGGATVRIPIGGEGSKSAVYLTGSGAWRANGASWSAADYRAAGVMANLELRPRDTATVRFGYRLDRRSFRDLPELNQTQHDGFVSALFNLASRTTIVGEAHVGAKSYEATVETTYASPLLDNVTAVRGGLGRGMGPSMRGAWSGSGSSTSVTANGAGQVTVFGRVAQSLTDRTGAWLQYSRRATFGRVPPVVVTTPALFFDDGVYDDPFASNASTVTAALKHQFASGAVAEFDFARMLKDYTATVALDLDGTPHVGEPLRIDRIWRASAGVSLPIAPSKTGALQLSLDVTYSYTRHRSNDVFYNYASHGMATGLSVGY